MQQYTNKQTKYINKQIHKMQQYIQTQTRGNVCLEHNKGYFPHTTNAKMQQYTHKEYKNAINKNKSIKMQQYVQNKTYT